MRYILYPFFLLLLLSCQEGGQKMAHQEKEKTLNQSVDQLFQDIIVVKMHLFTQAGSEDSADYPYMGKALNPEHYQYLHPDLQSRVEGTDKQIFACQKVQGGYYILRLPGQRAPSELLLCRYNEKEDHLYPVSVLAYAWCAGGECQQQDAWLDDLDTNRKLELILRARQVNAEGEVLNETFEVMMQDDLGNFLRGKEDLVNKTSYVMTEVFN